MASFNSFPIKTTDRKASELVFGLCPVLCGEISLDSPGTSAVVSEYGIRSIIDDKIMSLVTLHNDGTGEDFADNVGVDYDLNSANVYMSSLTGDSRFSIVLDSTGNIVNISYDGSAAVFNINANNMYVQGGREQITDTFGRFPPADSGGVISGNIYLLSGTTLGIPICANMQYSLSGDRTLSALACYEYNKDIAMGKIGIRIPYEHAFPVSNAEIYLGTVSEPTKFGYFKTMNAADVANNGEWANFTYSPEMQRNQYSYFTSPNQVIAYTKGLQGNVGGGSGISVLPCVPIMSESRILNDQRWAVNADDGGIFWGYATTSKDTGGKTYTLHNGNKPYDMDGSQYNPVIVKARSCVVVNYGWYHLFDRRIDRQPSDWKCSKLLSSGVDKITLNICFSQGKTVTSYVMKTGAADDQFVGDNFNVTNCPISWVVRGGVDGDVDNPPTSWTDIATVTNGIAGSSVKSYGNGFMEGKEHYFQLENGASYIWYQFEFTAWNMTDTKYSMQLGKLELYDVDDTATYFIHPVNVLPNFSLEKKTKAISSAAYTPETAEDASCKISSDIDSVNNVHFIAYVCDRNGTFGDTHEWITKQSATLPTITVDFKDSPRQIVKYSILQSTCRNDNGVDPMSWNFEARNGTDDWVLLQTVDISSTREKFAYSDTAAVATDQTGEVIDDHAYQTFKDGDYTYGHKYDGNDYRFYRTKRTFVIDNPDQYEQYRIVVKRCSSKAKKPHFSIGELELFEGFAIGGGGSAPSLDNTRFEARIFYDKVDYSSDVTYGVSLSALNDQTSQIVSSPMPSDGEVEISYLSGGMVMDGYVSTMYNVSANTTNPYTSDLIFYGQRGDNVSFPVNNGDTLCFYINSLSAALKNPTGKFDLQYHLRTF
jgi:hypothetical protein